MHMKYVVFMIRTFELTSDAKVQPAFTCTLDEKMDLLLHPGVNRYAKPPLLRFIPQFAQICIVFALSKFEANPCFRPVAGKAIVFYFSHCHALITLYVQFLCSDWSKYDR